VQENLKAHKLKFASHPSSSDEAPEQEPTIAHFSAGRSEVLGLSDSGALWLWSGNATLPGVQVKFRHTDVLMARSMFTKAAHTTSAGRITRAVSGWNSNSAFVVGKGIVFWKAHPRLSNWQEPNNNSLAVCVDDLLVPNSHYRRPRGKARDISPEEQQLGNTVGEVINHILLEDYVVFLTDLGKVFAIRHSNRAAFNKGIFELVHFVPSEASGDKMTDLQGSFRSFAVFNLQGEVLIGDQTLLHRAWASAFEPAGASFSADELRPARPPDLQNRGIVALAFGDWHKLALTKDGYVLSFGHEPEACGCLGLGTFSGEGLLRGVRYTGAGFRIEGDCEQRWRRLWFSPEQREWLRYLRRGGVNPQEGIQRIAHIPRDQADALALADWVEQHGSDWDRHPDYAEDTEDNVVEQARRENEPAYMAVGISAGGWGSAALVLRNKKKVESMYRTHAGFLPPPSGSENGESNAGGLALLTRLRSWLWADNTETASHPGSAVEDQRAGRHHAYYHSQRPWHVVSRELPESARHEVMLPALPM
jgi:SCF-associated factor 1